MADLVAPEQIFAAWCRQWYLIEWPHRPLYVPYMTKDDQRDKGDVRVGHNAKGQCVNIDEKAFRKRWDGLLVELLQECAPGPSGAPTSMGWFYHLRDCDFLVCGYFDVAQSAATPVEVYATDLRQLRAQFANLGRRPGVRTMRSIQGYGITIGLVIPWPALIDAGISRSVSPSLVTTPVAPPRTAEELAKKCPACGEPGCIAPHVFEIPW